MMCIVLMCSVICSLGLECPATLQLSILRKILKSDLLFFLMFVIYVFFFFKQLLILKAIHFRDNCLYYTCHFNSIYSLSINLDENDVYLTSMPDPKENASIF